MTLIKCRSKALCYYSNNSNNSYARIFFAAKLQLLSQSVPYNVLMKHQIIDAFDYPRALVRRSIYREDCPGAGTYLSNCQECRICKFRSECQWLGFVDDSPGLSRWSTNSLIAVLRTSVDYVDKHAFALDHDSWKCQCEACKWKRRAERLLGTATTQSSRHARTHRVSFVRPRARLPNLPENELLRGLQACDAASYEVLVQEYGPKIMAVARRYVANEADAADCAQNVLFQVCKNIDSYQQRSSLWYWIRGITIKQALMCLREQRRRPERSIDDLLPEFDAAGHRLEELEKRSDNPEDIVHTQDMKQFVRDAINDLPNNHRTVLLLRDIECFTTEETASILSIKVNTVKTRLHRARSALKKLLKPALGSGKTH